MPDIKIPDAPGELPKNPGPPEVIPGSVPEAEPLPEEKPLQMPSENPSPDIPDEQPGISSE